MKWYLILVAILVLISTTGWETRSYADEWCDYKEWVWRGTTMRIFIDCERSAPVTEATQYVW